MFDNELSIDGYRIISSAKLAGVRFSVCENFGAEYPYMVCDSRNYGNIIAEHSNVRYYGDITDAMLEFSGRIAEQTKAIIAEREKRNLPAQVFGSGDCEADGLNSDITNRVAVVKAESLAAEYRSADYQLIYVTHGNGAKPGALGRSVFGTELYSGEYVHYRREEVEGVIAADKLPDWAKEKLAELEKTREFSVMKAIEDGRAHKPDDSPEAPGKRKNKSEEER
jgi:hypothetical protein